MSKLTKALTAAAGNAGGDTCTLRMSSRLICILVTGAAQTITNGIDLDGEGGLVWIKASKQDSAWIICLTRKRRRQYTSLKF